MENHTDSEQRIGGRETARLCGISLMTLWRWRVERGFPPPTRIGARNFWKRSDVVEWLEGHADATQ